MRGARVKFLRKAYRRESATWEKDRRPLFGFRALKRGWVKFKEIGAALVAAKGEAK